MDRKRILYINHAGSLGGACISLLYLIQGLDQAKYEPVVCCIHNTPAVVDLYRRHGIKTLVCKGILDFPHTTGGWYPLYNPLAVFEFLKRLIYFLPSLMRTRNIIHEVQPALIHLNSLVLAPSAIGAKMAGVSLIWQIREVIHPGHFGVRRYLLSRLVTFLADETIFISHFDRQQLKCQRGGVIVYNFVDFFRFDRTFNANPVRKELGIPFDAKVVVSLGGQNVAKGIFPLLEALPKVKKQIPQMYCLIAAGRYSPSGRFISRVARAILPVLGSGTVAQRVERLIKRYHMNGYVHLLEWRNDAERLIGASDLLVFPSIEPHFARPVIEAGSMAKPVVASRIGAMEELVVDGETGLLVSPGDPDALANAIIKILANNGLAKRLGENAYQMTREKFELKQNTSRINGVYKQLLMRNQTKDGK